MASSATKNGNSASSGNGDGAQVLVTSTTSGVTVIDPSTPLKRLNYFDGKFLRADDFDVEQRYLRQLVALSNRGMGPGVVYGFDTTLVSGRDQVQIGPGLAMDPSGNVLLSQCAVTQSIQDLIDASKTSAAATTTTDASGKSGEGAFNDCVQVVAPPPTQIVSAGNLYVIAICSAEALCGQEDVYGKLCEAACVTSSDRPYRLDGVVLRAIPLQLQTAPPVSKAVDISADLYLRSKVAHQWYGDEVLKHPDSISRAGLLTSVWCVGAGYNAGCCEVPLAVVARSGSSTIFLDAWIVRRERIEAPPRRYWEWKMRMRPWDVFIAEILQFQCQLASVLSKTRTPGRASDPCASHLPVLRDAVSLFDQVQSDVTKYRKKATGDQLALLNVSTSQLAEMKNKIHVLLNSSGTAKEPTDRILINGGIIELPPAGYLPVATNTSVTVNEQVRALLGDGLDLRFCITTADYVAGAVEDRQHMDRIPLLQGIDDPSNQPHVDILVPDGTATQTTAPAAHLYDAALGFSLKESGGAIHEGAGREEALSAGGSALYVGAAGLSEDMVAKWTAMAKHMQSAKAKAVHYTADYESNPFINKPKATPERFNILLTNTAANARKYTQDMADELGTASAARERIITTKVPTTYGTVDGLWLTARSDKEIRSLGIDDKAAVSLRVVQGMHPAAPEAVELTFHGELTISQATSTANGPRLKGTLSGIYAVGMLKENQQQQKTTEFLMTERGSWPVEIKYIGDSASGSIAMTLEMPGGRSAIRITRTVFNGGARVDYVMALVPIHNGAAGAAVTAGRLRLVADSDIVNATNRYHRYADAGLDIVQAALVVSEPGVKKTADADLFPPAKARTRELEITAVRDWVAFVKRREQQCSRDVAPAPALPSRRYRVINITAGSVDEVKGYIGDFHGNLTNADPTKLTNWINALLKERSDETPLIVTFDGGTATAESDAASIEGDWRTFNPGQTIYYAAAGAVGETDGSLQTDRVKTVEGAIAADSQEVATAMEEAIVPYPDAALPAGADGLMLFITLTTASEQQHVYALNGEAIASYMKTMQGNTSLNPIVELQRFQAIDLGVATFTTGTGAAVSVDDTTVISNLQSKLPGLPVRAALVFLQATGTAADKSARVKAGGLIERDMTPAAPTPQSMTFTGTWPAGFPPSLLIVELHQQ